MPRSKDLSLVSRNQQVREMKEEGYTYQHIADTLGISRARVGQILAELDDEVSSDGYRAWLRAQGEVGLFKLQQILRQPRQIKVSASGRPVYELDPADPTGKTPDLHRPVYDDAPMIEAIRALAPLLDRLSKFSGTDLRQPKEQGELPEFAQGMSALEVLKAQNREMRNRLIAHGDPYAYDLDIPSLPWEDGTVYEAEVIEDVPASAGFLMRDGTARH